MARIMALTGAASSSSGGTIRGCTGRGAELPVSWPTADSELPSSPAPSSRVSSRREYLGGFLFDSSDIVRFPFRAHALVPPIVKERWPVCQVGVRCGSGLGRDCQPRLPDRSRGPLARTIGLSGTAD